MVFGKYLNRIKAFAFISFVFSVYLLGKKQEQKKNKLEKLEADNTFLKTKNEIHTKYAKIQNDVANDVITGDRKLLAKTVASNQKK